MTLYPDGYGTRLVTLERMVARHAAKQHPEFARRFFAYIESEGGRFGVGGGWRSTQPTGDTFAPDGKSFHRDQRFASGFVGYAAVDLVVPVPGRVHRAPTWAECDNAPTFGLHTFIKSPPEPWHIQCIEMRGWQSWVNAGRPDPQRFALPGDKPAPIAPPPPPPPIIGVPDVFYPIKPFRNYDTRGYGGAGVAPGTAHVVGLNPIFPANTIAVAVNVVAVGAQTPGFVTVWPDAHARPDTSIINYPGDGGAHNGAAVIGVNGGKFRIQTSTTCHLICDITGYWTS